MKTLFTLLLLMTGFAATSTAQALANTVNSITLTNTCLSQYTGTYTLVIHWNDVNTGPTGDITYNNVSVVLSGSTTTITIPGGNLPTTAIDGWELADTDGVMIKLLPLNGTANVIYFNFGQTNCAALPIKLKSFTGRIENNNKIRLTWVTEQEINSSHFIIERNSSTGGGTFDIQVGYKPASGNTTGNVTYTWDDLYPLAGDNIYRLKMVDENGSYTYSIVVWANCEDCSVPPQPTVDCSSYNISGPTLLCSGSAQYSINGPTYYNKYTWNYSPYNPVSVGPLSGNTITVTQNGNGMVTLQVEMSGCTNATKYRTIQIEVGKAVAGQVQSNGSNEPLLPDIQGANFVYGGNSRVAIFYPANAGTWSYEYGNVNSWSGDPNWGDLYFNLSQDESAVFRLDINTTCGPLSEVYYFQASNFSNFYSVSPSPASSQVTVFVDEAKLQKMGIKKSAEQSIQQIVIVDRSGRIVLQQKFASNTRRATVNIGPLHKDIYIVRIFNGKKWMPVKFVKQ